MDAPAPVDRTGFVGGSDLPKIIGVSEYGDAFSLYLEKRGEVEPPTIESKVQRRGKILEPAIIQLYAAECGVDVRPGVTLSMPNAPHFRAQVDALEYLPEVDEFIPVEIKSASEFTRSKWGPSGTDDAPTAYCAQLHWQMIATGAKVGRIVALLGADDLRVYTLERDDAICTFLLQAATTFWGQVQAGTPPEIDYAHPSVGDTLARLFKNPNSIEIAKADDKLRAWRDVYVEAGERARQYEAVKEGAKAHLLGAMRNAAILDFEDGQMFERKVVKRKGYTVEACSYIDARLKKTAAPQAGTPALSQEIAA
jgi:putative phage-type endonuclease